MAKRVATKPRKMWAVVSKSEGYIWVFHRARDEARKWVTDCDYNGRLYWRVEPVMVTPIKRKAKS